MTHTSQVRSVTFLTLVTSYGWLFGHLTSTFCDLSDTCNFVRLTIWSPHKYVLWPFWHSIKSRRLVNQFCSLWSYSTLRGVVCDDLYECPTETQCCPYQQLLGEPPTCCPNQVSILKRFHVSYFDDSTILPNIHEVRLPRYPRSKARLGCRATLLSAK